MSNIISIEQLRKEFLEKNKSKDLPAFAAKQQELLEKLVKEKESLEQQLSHANEIIKTLGQPLSLSKDNEEELICIEQIKILKIRSSQRELDINEVKKLDLLIKNLRLIRSQPTDNIKTDYRDISEVELVAIATNTKEN